MNVIFEFTPGQKANLALHRLAMDPKFHTDFVLGGTMPPEMVRKNAKIMKKFEKERLNIIAKYGAIKEFARPLQDEIRQLRRMLCEKTAALRDLQLKCKHRNIQREKSGPHRAQFGICKDCGARLWQALPASM